MKLIVHPEEFRQECRDIRAGGKELGFVPTMGALHAGHLSLIDGCRQAGAVPVVSVFVNPTQFAPTEDLSRYPRPRDADLRKCREAGVEAVFLPTPASMYPPGEGTRVRVDSLSSGLCGAGRPRHFEGVCTVVTKLLSIVGPCVAAFGKKDYQQLRIVARLVEDLFLPVRILEMPIVREEDGLAMSSRNRYLGAEERQRALVLARSLSSAWALFNGGARESTALLAAARAELEGAAGLALEYLELRDAASLTDVADRVQAPALLAVAAKLGSTRLIDNVVLGEDADPLEAKQP